MVRLAGSAKESREDRLLDLPGELNQTSGPSGIRTHDLLNAIETRSQLRHGPCMKKFYHT